MCRTKTPVHTMPKKAVYTLRRVQHEEVSIQQKIRKHIVMMEVHTHANEMNLALATCLELTELFLSAEDYGKTIVI